PALPALRAAPPPPRPAPRAAPPPPHRPDRAITGRRHLRAAGVVDRQKTARGEAAHRGAARRAAGVDPVAGPSLLPSPLPIPLPLPSGSESEEDSESVLRLDGNVHDEVEERARQARHLGVAAA